MWERPEPPRGATDREAPTPKLWPFELRRVSGVPVLVAGEARAEQQDRDDSTSTSPRPGSADSGRSTHIGIGPAYAAALDALGMGVALAFERARLERSGGGCVVDVSSPERIYAAWDELASGLPLIRTARDPFGQLRAHVDSQQVLRRSVTVASFAEAEEEVLQILSGSGHPNGG